MKFSRILCTALAIAALSKNAVAAEADFKEPGRFGFLGALTEDMWKGGFVYESDLWEASAIGHYNVQDGDTTDIHIIFKGGYRKNLGTYNYLALGMEYGFHPGAKDKGVSVNGYNVGPYVGLERHFSGTNLMLSLWVNPFMFEHVLQNNGSGGVQAYNSRHVIQTGGFGIAYLF